MQLGGGPPTILPASRPHGRRRRNATRRSVRRTGALDYQYISDFLGGKLLSFSCWAQQAFWLTPTKPPKCARLSCLCPPCPRRLGRRGRGRRLRACGWMGCAVHVAPVPPRGSRFRALCCESRCARASPPRAPITKLASQAPEFTWPRVMRLLELCDGARDARANYPPSTRLALYCFLALTPAPVSPHVADKQTNRNA